MTELNMTIDLAQLTDNGRITNLAGKSRGEAAREFFDVDSLDAEGGSIEVLVPNNLIAISSSYFLGLFSNSLRKFPVEERFKAKYHFRASPLILKQVDHAISRSLAILAREKKQD